MPEKNIICPQCSEHNEEGAKNCDSCRINLYWAFQHYEELARLRSASDLHSRSAPAAFLIRASKQADRGPVANWLKRTISRFGLKGAGQKISTLSGDSSSL